MHPWRPYCAMPPEPVHALCRAAVERLLPNLPARWFSMHTRVAPLGGRQKGDPFPSDPGGNSGDYGGEGLSRGSSISGGMQMQGSFTSSMLSGRRSAGPSFTAPAAGFQPPPGTSPSCRVPAMCCWTRDLGQSTRCPLSLTGVINPAIAVNPRVVALPTALICCPI